MRSNQGPKDASRAEASRRRRRGGMAVLVLVCLVIIASISAQLLRLSLSGRSLGKAEERTIQAEWLAESGLERARAQLAADPKYAGESWEVKAEELGGQHAGLVTIAVQAPEGDSKRRRIEVKADYPRDQDERSRISKALTIETAESKTGEAR